MTYPPLPLHHPVRQEQIAKLNNSVFDVVILGGGINGTCLYHYLKQQGYRVAIIDAKDFAAGTTQHSGMMIWGGLLYLQNFDLKAVYQFSKARDQLITQFPQYITPRKFHFIHSKNHTKYQIFDYLGLNLYWLFSQFKRERPQITSFNDQQKMLSFEEAQLLQSDAQFALAWLNLLPQSENLCMNYFEITQGKYNLADKLWHLEGIDQLFKKEYTLKTKWVINACGVWADQVNKQFNIATPFRHLLSKGVYLNLKHEDDDPKAYIYEMGQYHDVLTYIPWGPVALWGPTETPANSIEEGFSITEQDISFLLEKGKALPNKLITEDKIVSTRCGIRPLAVKKNAELDGVYSLEISRQHRITIDPLLPWMSIFGGKISGCTIVAQQIVKALLKRTSPSLTAQTNKHTQLPPVPTTVFPEFDFPIPDIKWCMENQFCFTLEDYLRRRTNIAQWIENNGFGFNNKFRSFMKDLCLTLCLADPLLSQQHIDFYKKSMHKKQED